MMTSINICFSTANGFISKTIRWFTRARVSHALITFYDVTLKRVFVMEANGRGFMLVPWSHWRQSHTLHSRYKLVADQGIQNGALCAVGGQLGAQYDYIGIISFALRRIWKRFSNPLADPNKMFCSEVVARFLKEAGFEKFDDTESWTPEDLLKALENNPQFLLLEESNDESTGA